MVLTEETLHDSLKVRRTASRWGIGVAKNYLLGANPQDFDATPEQWSKHLEEAAKRLTYCSDEFETKEFKDGSSATDGAILTFDGICTTRRKDRDGDVVESKGLELDHRMPLLWQHSQFSPVGKHMSLIEQSEKLWASKWGIADTLLGRDSAVLAKFGSLRLSIGFKPTEFEPLAIEENSAGEKFVVGWHIKKAQVMETSLVSIPANSDATILSTFEKEFDGICTAVGKGLLKHDGVKHWAKSLYEKRPVQVPGVTLKEEQVTKDTMGGELLSDYTKCEACGEMKVDLVGACQACGRQHGKSAGELNTKDAAPTETKGISHYPKGCFEQIQTDLDRSARKYLKAKGTIDADEYSYAYLYVTFADKAIICVHERDYKTKCYSIAYKVENGAAEWTGEPAEVDVEPAVIAKFVANKIHTKTTEIVTKEVTKEVVKEVIKELSLDELRRQFLSKAFTGGVEGYKALKEATELLEVFNLSREAKIL